MRGAILIRKNLIKLASRMSLLTENRCNKRGGKKMVVKTADQVNFLCARLIFTLDHSAISKRFLEKVSEFIKKYFKGTTKSKTQQETTRETISKLSPRAQSCDTQ